MNNKKEKKVRTSINEILESCELEQRLPEIDCKDYVRETKKILQKLIESYNSAYKHKWLPTKIWDKIDDKHCNDCNQECKLNIDGEIREVHADDKQGDCYYMYFDTKEFMDNIDEIIIGDNSLLYEMIEFKVKYD